mgnify:CR=1 FL=1
MENVTAWGSNPEDDGCTGANGPKASKVIPFLNYLNIISRSFHTYTVMPEPGGPEKPLAPLYLADQLTLFQPGEGRLSQLLAPKLFHLPASLHTVGTVNAIISYQMKKARRRINQRSSELLLYDKK